MKITENGEDHRNDQFLKLNVLWRLNDTRDSCR